tara:strand:- start:3501 stop:3671 length:171 start_codon:yes stop_codon:yes gene_type:complete
MELENKKAIWSISAPDKFGDKFAECIQDGKLIAVALILQNSGNIIYIGKKLLVQKI